MEFDEVIVKEGPGLCRCCLAEGALKDLDAAYPCGDQTEIYADMLLEAFDVCLSRHMEAPNDICETCVLLLRDAYHFKKKVQDSERRFLEMIDRGELQPKVLLHQAGMKKEPSSQEFLEDVVANLDDYDFGDDPELEEPLQNLKKSKEDDYSAKRRIKKLTKKSKLSKVKKKDKVIKVKKAKSSEIVDTDEISAKRKSNIPSKRRRKNLEILFNNTTVIPFKWRGKYLCFYCGKDIAEYADLKKHTISHGRCSIEDYGIQLVRSGEIEIKIDISDITCEICNEPFPNLEEITLHLMLKHNMDYDKNVDLCITTYKLVDLTCLDCGESFSFFRRLVNHVNTMHPRNVLVCDKCSQTFNKRRDLASHVRNYHKDGGYNCDECDLEFVSKTKLRAHKESDHLHTCNVCFEKFSSSAKKVKHIDETHLRDGVLQCGFCQRVCSTRQAFLQHTSKCKIGRKVFDNTGPNNTINVDDIDEKKPTVRVIRNNLACIFNMSTALPFKFFMNRFRCFYCPKDFSESEELRQHTVLEHPMCDTKHRSMKLRARDDVDIKLDISSLNCKVCFETMPDLNTLIDHLVMEHKAVYDKTVDCKIVTFRLHKENFLCPLCNESEVYKFFGNLLKHMNVAHSNNQLICVFCGKSFRTDPNLRSHIARHHRPAKLKCETCELVFTTGVKLNTHLARAHGKKVVKCPKCPEQFLSSYSRQKHLISVHNFGSTCPHCGRMFTRNSLVRDHIRRIHLKEKTVECPVCSMKFFDHFMLKMHMVRHAGDRNFHCDKCGKKFLWKKNLKNHMATHEKHAGSHNVEIPI